MNNLMNVDNHMNSGLPYPQSWEEPEEKEDEINAKFEAWFKNNNDDELAFECFLDSWAASEVKSFMESGTMLKEFMKFKCKMYQDGFENETDLHVSYTTVNDLVEA